MRTTLVMTTKNGIHLLFNAELGGFLSSDPEAVMSALKEDMASSDKIAAKMAREILIASSYSGGIHNLSEI